MHEACIAGEMAQGGLILFLGFYSLQSEGYLNKTPSFKVGEGGYMKRPRVFLQSGGSCLSTIVLTISLESLNWPLKKAHNECLTQSKAINYLHISDSRKLGD